MLYYYIAVVFITVLDYATFFLNDVTMLPFGVDGAMNTFVGTIKGFLDLMPWFRVVWNLMLLALTIKFFFWGWYWIKFIIGLIRGSGSSGHSAPMAG